MSPLEHSYTTTESPEYSNMIKAQEKDLKMTWIVLKEEITKSLKETQENTDKQLEELRKSLKESQENKNNQLKQTNKSVQDLKIEKEAIKKT